MNNEQLTLFDLQTVSTPTPYSPVHDPYWDELEKQCDNLDQLRQHHHEDGATVTSIIANSLARLHEGSVGEQISLEATEQTTLYEAEVVDNTTPATKPSNCVGEQVNYDTAPQHINTVGGQLNLEDSPCKSVGGQVTTTTAPQHQYVAPQHTHWVEKYWVERGNNKYWYYRYCWMEGRKIRRRYIGSVRSAIANYRKTMVSSAIADGETPAEIQNLIKSWS